MDPTLLNAFRCGNTREINKRLALRNPDLFTGRTRQGNTALHLAARLRNKHVVVQILGLIQSSFLYDKNENGESPMHIAAKAGDASVIKIFLYHDDNRVVMGGGQESILLLRDNRGNTPLHNAVSNLHDMAAIMLIYKNPDTLRCVNRANESPLSIALEANSTYIAWFIIKEHTFSLDHRGPNQLTLLHCAVIRQDYVIVLEILKTKKELINTPDQHKRNPLHYAAVLGNVAIARQLLISDDSSSLGYKIDRNGETPLHLAAQNGKLSFLTMLVIHYPDAIELLNAQQHNILHLAALNGHINTVEYILTLPEMEYLINSTDVDGNTPLHLAAMNFHGKVVDILSQDKRVNLRATNQNHLTAPAIVESSTDPHCDIEKQQMTAMILKKAFAERAFYPEDLLEGRRLDGTVRDHPIKQKMQEEKKEIAQPLLVIATLIATFTFTAAFTMPGGYKDEGKDEGMAVLDSKFDFQLFVITVAIAMISSMTAAVLALGQIYYKNDEHFMNVNLIPLASLFIWLGLVSMSVAFVSGLHVVLSNNSVLAAIVLVIGCVFPLYLLILGPFFGLPLYEYSLPQVFYLSPVQAPVFLLADTLEYSFGQFHPSKDFDSLKLFYILESSWLRCYDKAMQIFFESGLYTHTTTLLLLRRSRWILQEILYPRLYSRNKL